MSSQTAIVIVLLVFAGAMFTNYYGLGTLWENRGSWYLVTADELDTVIYNLYNLQAFKDADGLDSKHIKIKVHAWGPEHKNKYYRVKVPNRIFTYEKIKFDNNKKAELLGLKLR